MRSFVLVLGLAATPLSPALAHDHDWPLDTDIGLEQALETAYADGLVLIRSAEFDDGVWQVEGRDSSGKKVEIDIDGASGAIVSR